MVMITDNYEVVKKLKEGNRGLVYRVRDAASQQLQVLKIIYLIGEHRREAEDEAKILKESDHRNIVRFVDSFEFIHERIPSFGLVVECLSGGDLDDYLEENREQGTMLTRDKVLTFTSQLVSAVAYCHERGIVHRDIKPKNIFLGPNHNLLKIGDFDVSKVINETYITKVVGTPLFLPPEAQENQMNLNFQSDVWAIGVVVQIMCTLRHPFEGANRLRTMINIAEGARTPKQVQFPDVEGLVKRCLQSDLTAREDNAVLLADDPSIKHLIDLLNFGFEPSQLQFDINERRAFEIITEKISNDLDQSNKELQRVRAELQGQNKDLQVINKKISRDLEIKDQNLRMANRENDELKKEKFGRRILEDYWKDRDQMERENTIGHNIGLDTGAYINCSFTPSMARVRKEESIRVILRALKSGIRRVNVKMYCLEFDISEVGLRLRQKPPMSQKGYWNLWLLGIINNQPLHFEAKGEEIHTDGTVSTEHSNFIQCDQYQMVSLRRESHKGYYIRWNINIL